MSTDTYYSLLDVSENASQTEIKAAYRELVRQVHPDSVPKASPYWKRAAEEKTKEINEAYGVLSHVKKRREYDRLLAEARQDPRQAQPSNPASPPVQPSAPKSQPTANPPMQSTVSRFQIIEAGFWVGCLLLFVVAIIFGLLRTIWVALFCSAIFAAMMSRRNLLRMSPLYKLGCIAGLAVSVCFVIADVLYPAEESRPARVAGVSAPAPRPTPAQLQAPHVDVEPPKHSGDIRAAVVNRTAAHPLGQLAQHLPSGVFSADPKPPDPQPLPVRTLKAHSEADPAPEPEESTLPLNASERQSIVGYCSTAKFGQGPAAYNQCVKRQLELWAVGPRPPDLSSLSTTERLSIEAVCSRAKYEQGPAAYNQCLVRQHDLWAAGAKQPDLSPLSSSERQSVEVVCSRTKYGQGLAAYNQCLIRQLDLWAAGPKRPDLSGLSSSERQSVETVCSRAKYGQGPAAYNQCLVEHMQSLGSHHQ